ncbi:MAG: glucuronate isomerase [Clostridia bacterium]|nr:glucuronate isomerase [Clostridia bacterium]
MHKNYLLENKTAKKLYSVIGSAPIYDYHCHLSPKEIYEDKPFENIGKIWLAGDHYKWRLMRTAGISEEYITGSSSDKEKFTAYAEAISLAAGNPLYHWSHMELSQFFGIDLPINKQNADRIWEQANNYIAKTGLSPRKCIKAANVNYIATTDDPADSLEYHAKLREDNSFQTVVAPSFRTDNLLLIMREGYADYIVALSKAANTNIHDLASLCSALLSRLDSFVENGCTFTDVGIPYFPTYVASDAEADAAFKKALVGETITWPEYSGFLGYMYCFLAKAYKERNLVMQWHLAVYRNANTGLFEQLGADCGVDCIGNAVNGDDLIHMLDAIENASGLPETIIYTLNSGAAEQIATIAGAFRNVHCGAAWWFCDHKRGIAEELQIIAENRALGTFYGMLTDSRSFLSYARHDYFRRILASFLGDMAQKGEVDMSAATEIAERVAYKNIAKRIGGK